MVEQRIVEKAARLTEASQGCVTGWAALRWRGAAFFDGLAPDGVRELPVELALGGATANLRQTPGLVLTRPSLPPDERDVVDGLCLSTPQRALFDEIVRRGDLWSSVQAIDMTAAAGLISVWLFATYLGGRNGRTGVPLARRAVSLAVDESRSPRETWLRLVWLLDAGLPDPLVNHPVYDDAGWLIGVPDLLDPITGLVAEYDGAHHKGREQHRRDVAREERFRDHGLEYTTVVAGDARKEVARRLARAQGRAGRLPDRVRRWTTERPSWDPAPETLDAALERQGLSAALVRPGW